MDRLTKVCLVAIVFLLAVIAVRPLVSPGVVEAAGGKKYEFRFDNRFINGADNPQLAKDGLDGWQIVGWESTHYH